MVLAPRRGACRDPDRRAHRGGVRAWSGSLLASALACGTSPPAADAAPVPSAAPPPPVRAAPAAPANGSQDPRAPAGEARGPPSVQPQADPCAPSRRVTLAFVGDVIPHRELQLHGLADPAGFAPLFADVADLLTATDLTLANLETTIAPATDRIGRDLGSTVAARAPAYGDGVFFGYPSFNAPPALLQALAGAGVDVLITANNHALDRRTLGAERTLEQVRAAGLSAIGTRPRGADAWPPLVRALSGASVAIVACTDLSNVRPDDDDVLLHCTDELAAVIAAIAAARDAGADAVVVFAHWGSEYVTEPTARQRKLARAFASAGADAVVGSHPHVVQPIERITLTRGDAQVSVPVAYSLGNFVSHQPSLPSRTGALLLLDVIGPAPADERAGAGPAAGVAALSWLPLVVERSPGRRGDPLDPTTEAPAERFRVLAAARPDPSGARGEGPAGSRAELEHLRAILGADDERSTPVALTRGFRLRADPRCDVPGSP